jgi:hypothetical protein
MIKVQEKMTTTSTTPRQTATERRPNHARHDGQRPILSGTTTPHAGQALLVMMAIPSVSRRTSARSGELMARPNHCNTPGIAAQRIPSWFVPRVIQPTASRLTIVLWNARVASELFFPSQV